MKKLILVAIIAVFAMASNAQSNAEEIALMQSVYGMQKKDLIAKHMKIEAGKADLFWQMYDEYEVARKEIGTQRVKNIEQYASKYENLTNEDADALVKASMEVQKSFISLWDKTYKKMAKSISPITAAQFIQAEMFFENMVRQELSLDIPLIGEFDVKK
ncbi:MAG TPA: hypothetical protein VLQ91_04450 [Draconibacterium sp.]|nr:hypothetical protein [Draconibacterium sp.]